MVTKLNYDKRGQFNISGTIKIDNVNFETKEFDSAKFFPFAVQLMLNLKGTLLKQLSDDQKILGDERIQVIASIDKFLTIIFELGFIISDEPFAFDCEYKSFFEIELSMTRMNYFSGTGKLLNIPSKDIGIDVMWYDNNIIGIFKSMVSLFGNKENHEKIRSEIIKLLYNLFALRYKIEFV